MKNITEVKQAIADTAGAGIGIIAMKTMAGRFWDKERKDPVNTKAALKYTLQIENIHTSIPGANAFNELEENFEVNVDISLTPDEIKDLRFDEANECM